MCFCCIFLLMRCHCKGYSQLKVIVKKSNLMFFYQKKEMECAMNPMKSPLAKCCCDTSGFAKETCADTRLLLVDKLLPGKELSHSSD